MGALIRYLTSTVPALAIKTGFSCKTELGNSLGQADSMSKAAARAKSGTPVLALDVRPRIPRTPAPEPAREARLLGGGSVSPRSRADLIEAGKMQINETCDALLEKGIAETFDICTLAYMHDVLTGDGDSLTTELHGGRDAMSGLTMVPLHEAIRRAREDTAGDADDDGLLPRATAAQTSDVAEWLTERIFSDAWRVRQSQINSIDGLNYKPKGGFPTVGLKAIGDEPLKVSSGKWYYEVTIGNGSLAAPQFGWCDERFNPPDGHGVGDDLHSWGVDGDRVTAWGCGGSTDFGKAWKPGDVVGFMADLDSRTLSFSLNGSSEAPMGVAFTDIEFRGSLFPAVTASSCDATFNFGEDPARRLKFLPDGYSPIVPPSEVEQLAAMIVLISTSQNDELGYYTTYEPLMFAQTTYSRLLLSSPNFYHLNLTDMEGAKKLVNQLVRLDRLPTCNPLEGLLLLRSAWCDYDVSMLLAEQYKRACKRIFALQIVLSWLVVVGAGLGDSYSTRVFGRDLDEIVPHAVFGISVTFSILVSLDGMLNPKARWRQLRSSASSLHSIVWMYRTRTGPFELEETRRDSTRPESVLCAIQTQWRDDLAAGAGLKTTSLLRQYPAHVYCHFQDRGGAVSSTTVDDDHHSPTQPSRYVKLRVEPMITFYTNRIPVYTRHGLLLRFTILVLGVAASVLARYEELSWVTTATAAATAVMSWAEFSDAARKVERYSSAVGALKNLLSWWDSLGEVQKASKEAIKHLVQTAEAIISEEQFSWTATKPAVLEQGGEAAQEGDVEKMKLQS
jgi:hypothetical protein